MMTFATPERVAMDVSRLSPLTAIRAPEPPPPSPSPLTEVEAPAAVTLEPAVKLDLGRSSSPPRNDGDERRVAVDPRTQDLLYQVIDADLGTIMVQLPDPSVIKARAYAREEAQARAEQGDKPPLVIA